MHESKSDSPEKFKNIFNCVKMKLQPMKSAMQWKFAMFTGKFITLNGCSRK